eukprot:1657370-Prymnesium_polylepis.1
MHALHPLRLAPHLLYICTSTNLGCARTRRLQRACSRQSPLVACGPPARARRARATPQRSRSCTRGARAEGSTAPATPPCPRRADGGREGSARREGCATARGRVAVAWRRRAAAAVAS